MDDVAAPVQLDCPPQWHEPVLACLRAAGIRIDTGAAVGVAVTSGRLVSATLDDWTVSSLPHLLVSVRPGDVEVGPWVAPGIGPCARCVAAAVLDEGGPPRPDLLPRPLVALAAGWAARELGAWRRGETPHTWLTSWRLSHEPDASTRRWERHPYCGCAWWDTA